jgi:NAD(P)-dependent dehydrogenase (short-subunit alcohol dehydrogenase family)
MDLRGKTALVTGAASGIGRETALAFAREGAQLVLCDVNEGALADVAREAGGVLMTKVVDVSKRDAMRAFADEVHAKVDAVDVLVNNAGVGLSGGILDTTLEDWDWILGINLLGVVHGCHFFVPRMVSRGRGGHVVNVSSTLGFIGAPDVIGYCTTKFGVFGLSECLRTELAPHHIGVSTICPGVIATSITKTMRVRGNFDTEKRREQVDAMFKKRAYGPEKVAAAITDAVKNERGVVPVAPEAWTLYFVKRFAPRLGERIGRMLRERAIQAE